MRIFVIFLALLMALPFSVGAEELELPALNLSKENGYQTMDEEEDELDGELSADVLYNVDMSLGSSLDLVTDEKFRNQEISWLSSDPDIVSVDNGIVYSHQVGEAFVSGALKNGESLLFMVYVSADVVRIAGDSRINTAIEVADQLKKTLGRSTFDTIIIANGDNFADALTGSYLANVKKAPILLYRAKGMELNEAYIQENLSADGVVYILGGSLAVPAGVEDSLKNAGYNVQRLAGASRFDTNLKILETAGITNEEILLCTGWQYADSLAASATGLPILMLNTTTNELTENQIDFFEQYADNGFTVIGGSLAVSEKLEEKIEDIVGSVDRVYGQSREDTAVALAQRYFTNPDFVMLAYSRNFPDGLCGGPLANAMKAPLLLVTIDREASAAAYVDAEGISKGYILGGSLALSERSVQRIFFR